MNMRNLFALAALAALAGCSDDGTRNSIVFPADNSYTPPRRYESSVLNAPDSGGSNDWAGRGYRVGGSGYGPWRDHPQPAKEPGGKAIGIIPIEKTTDNR